jgi:metallo-beta-lactamase class B
MLLALALSAPLAAAPGPRPFSPDPPKTCDSCVEWNAPREPYRIFGNTHYVGTGALTSLLITSDAGHILLDGGLPQSAPLIDANIRRLGFRTEDVRLILSSHAHFDHAGGIAALQRASGATVAASAKGARALAAGGPTADDPQYGLGAQFNSFPPVKNVRVVGAGETVRAGTLAITAHLTPGHTPGSTTWTWRSCEASRCLDMVYADSLSAVSADDFKFTAIADGGAYVAAFRRSLETIAKLPCDILLTPHPSASGMDEKLRRRTADPGVDAFVDPQSCRGYAETAGRALDRRLAEETGTPAVTPAQ